MNKSCTCLCLICASYLCSYATASRLPNNAIKSTPPEQELPELSLLENANLTSSDSSANIRPTKIPHFTISLDHSSNSSTTSNPNSKCNNLDMVVVVADISLVWIIPLAGAFLPYILSRLQIKNNPNCISCINCVGAGILLATCFFHLWPEIQEEFQDLPGYDKHDRKFELWTIKGY